MSRSLRTLDVLYLTGFASLLAALSLVTSGRRPAAAALGGTAIGAFCLARRIGRSSPQPMSFTLRWVLLLPRFGHSPRRLLKLLQPEPGEHVLDVGAGVGVHAIPIARALGHGTLVAVDVQPRMTDELSRRARRYRIATIEALTSDARQLPYADHIFDAACLVSVLGELTDRAAALAELRRVLKGRGRLVVGEMILDPDFVSQRELTELAEKAGFAVEEIVGSRLSYLMLLRPASAAYAAMPSVAEPASGDMPQEPQKPCIAARASLAVPGDEL